MSFWLDWWLLIVYGVAITIITRILQHLKIAAKKDTLFNKYLFFIIIIGFYVFSVGLFCGFSAQPGGVNPFGFLGNVNDMFFNWIKTSLYPAYYQANPTFTSTEFMFSSGEEWLKNMGAAPFDNLQGLLQHPFHLFVAIGLFMMYPYFLRWGVRLGEMMFGSKPGKKGMLGIL
jgi:hypothetical protein